MKRRKNRELNVFSISFLDVLSNAVGGLAFLLIVVFFLLGRRFTWDPPEILTERLPEAVSEQQYQLSLSARGGGGKYSWSVVEGELPPGLALDAASGCIQGVPRLPSAKETGGKHQFTLQCTATHLGAVSLENRTAEATLTMTVQPSEPHPAAPVQIVSPPSLPDAYGNQAYPLVFASRGGAPPYQWEAEGDLPAGLRLTPSGALTGTPRDLGTFDFDLSVTAENGTSDREPFRLNVLKKHPPPPAPPELVLRTHELADAIADRRYPLIPSAEGGVPPYTWRIVGPHPRWLKRDNEGPGFTGTPSYHDLGKQTLVLEVEDNKGSTARSEPLPFDILPQGRVQPHPLEILTERVPTAVTNRPYTFTFAARGGYLPYKWSCRGLDPSSQLHFDTETGQLGGKPEKTDQMTLAVTIIDAAGHRDAVELPFRIVVPRPPLRLLTRAAPTGMTTRLYVLALSASGGFPPYSWKVVDGGLPAGLALQDSGVITGTPEEPGDYEFKLQVADAMGQSRRYRSPIRLRILTRKQARKLVIETEELPLLVRGEPISLAPACSGGLPPYQWTIGGNPPPGLACESTAITGIPRETGTFPVALKVSDAEGQSAEMRFPVHVKWLLPWWWVLAAVLVAGIAVFLALRALRRPPLEPLKITTEELPNARASCPYNVKLACEGGRPPYRWKVADGELPQGLSLSEDGRISGIPFKGVSLDETKSVPFTVEVQDANKTKVKQDM